MFRQCIEDQNRAFEALAENINKTSGESYSLGGGAESTISLQELLNLIETLTGKRSPVTYGDWRIGDQKVYISDTTKMKDHTGWKPHVTVEEGIKRLITWTKEHLHYFS